MKDILQDISITCGIILLALAAYVFIRELGKYKGWWQ